MGVRLKSYIQSTFELLPQNKIGVEDFITYLVTYLLIPWGDGGWNETL